MPWKGAKNADGNRAGGKETQNRAVNGRAFAIPPEDVNAAYKNILSELNGVVKPTHEKTEAVLKAENIILKISLEMGI